MTDIWLGDDLATYKQVDVPIGHLAVFGQTRRAGKTTTLRTLIGDAVQEGAHAVVFRTGRGEIPFPGAHHLTPFFREKLDWRNVEAMVWTFLAEKPRVYRPIIMKAVHGAKTLEEVHRNIVAAGKVSKNGWVVDRTYELDQYFQEILPWLRDHRLGTELELESGVNVVDLEGWPGTVQQLVVAATLERLMEITSKKRSVPVIAVLPEGRTFIPSDRATPAKLAADHFAREGAKLNLFLWIDSQSLTGVDQLVLRNFALLLQGVQTSDIEISRICKALDGVKPAMVRRLKVGDFILSTDDGVRTVHVPLVEPKEEEVVDDKERRELEERIRKVEEARTRDLAHVRELEGQLEDTKIKLRAEHARAEANAKAAAANAVEKIRAAPKPGPVQPTDRVGPLVEELAEDASPRERVDLHVFSETPNLTVHEKVVTVEADGEDLRGRVALLVADGFFRTERSPGGVAWEFRNRGWGRYDRGPQARTMAAELQQFAAWAFLRATTEGYAVVPEAEARVRRVKEKVVA